MNPLLRRSLLRPATPAALALLLSLPAARASADPFVADELGAVDAHLVAHPEDVGARLERSELLFRASRPDDAFVELRMAAALDPGNPWIAAQRASLLHRVGRDDEALAEIDASLAAMRRAPVDSLTLRAHVLVALGRLEEAAIDFDAALALGDDVELYLERGRLLERLGRFDEAARGYEEGVLSLGATSLRVAAIELDLRGGHPERALRWVDELLPTLEVAARWRLLRARALDGLNRAAEARTERLAAVAELDRRIARRPVAASYVERAGALLELGRVDEALADARRAVLLAPALRDATVMFGRVGRTAGGAR